MPSDNKPLLDPMVTWDLCHYYGITRPKWVDLVIFQTQIKDRYLEHSNFPVILPSGECHRALLMISMAWCHQAISRYLSQCWPRSMSLFMASLGHTEFKLYCTSSIENDSHWGQDKMASIFQTTSHHLNQWWLVYWRICTSLGLN